MPTQEQIDYFKQNTIKNASIRTWVVVSFTHPDWSQDLDYVAIESDRGVEFDESIYNFEGVQYKPVSMSYRFPNESDETGKATVTFARAATELKKLMSQITPANVDKPITFSMKQYQEGTVKPVKVINAFVAKNYPKISGQDIQVQASRLNPALNTSKFISTLDLYPELRTA